MRGNRIFPLILLLSGVLFSASDDQDKSASKYDDLFEKARLIMTKEEIRIYKHLPDEQSKQEFFEEFWRLRNPDPSSDENEALIEFQRRIEYANRQFREIPTLGLGWNSDRGRILIILGFPDQVYNEQDYSLYASPVAARPSDARYEFWEYYFNDFSLMVEFLDRNGMGKYELQPMDPHLNAAMDRVRYAYGSSFMQRKLRFIFTVTYKNRQLHFVIPSKTLFWEEKEGEMRAPMTVAITVYRDYKRLKQFSQDSDIKGSKEQLAKKKKLEVMLPMPELEPGHYMLDIVLTEKLSNTRYRQVLTCDYK